jgi:hypothetical protein
MRIGRASILFDPGWLFVLAGLVLVASATLVPATYDLWVMRTQLRHLDAQERENCNRLEAYSRFVQELDAADPQLVRRLAASQLNLVPRGERPVIVAASAGQTPIEWADATVEPVRASVVPFPDSLLSRLTLGRKALWIAGAGAMCIFLGLLSAPLRLRLPAAPSVDEAGAAAARALGVPAPAMLSFAGGARLPTAAPDTSSSAESAVRIGVDSPADSESGPHGAD